MALSTSDLRLLSIALANIEADLQRSRDSVEEMLAIGGRLSRLAGDVTLACERAFLEVSQEIAA